MGFNDEQFQDRVLALMVTDIRFLKRMSGLLSWTDFSVKGEAGAGSWARECLAKLALRWWRKYREPLGGMAQVEAMDYVRTHKQSTGKSYRQALLDLVETISDPALHVAPGAIEEKYRAYKSRQTMRSAVSEFAGLQMKGELTSEVFMQIARKATAKLGEAVEVSDYSRTLEQRISRRERERERKYPLLHIEPLDKAVPTIPRGQVAMWLAKYGMGKSTALVHTAQAHAIQGFNVLYFTLEDPRGVMEDRMDASLIGIGMDQLVGHPKYIRRHWESVQERLKGKIKIIDGTGGGWSVERMSEVWDVQRQRGYAADVIIVDYDEKIEPPVRYKGDSAARMQSKDVYESLTNWAARDQLYIWTAAQAKRLKENVMIVTGDDAAEDINKLRICAFCIGIGSGPKDMNLGPNGRYIHIAKHRFGASKIGWPIIGDFEKAIFFDREASEQVLRVWNKHRRSGDVE